LSIPSCGMRYPLECCWCPTFGGSNTELSAQNGLSLTPTLLVHLQSDSLDGTLVCDERDLGRVDRLTQPHTRAEGDAEALPVL